MVDELLHFEKKRKTRKKQLCFISLVNWMIHFIRNNFALLEKSDWNNKFFQITSHFKIGNLILQKSRTIKTPLWKNDVLLDKKEP